MDYIDDIVENLATRIVSRNKPDIIGFCVENGISYGDEEEFVEQFDVAEFDDFTTLLLEEIADASMHYGDAYEILKEYGWLSNWDKLTDYINGGEWYSISQVAEAALWYEECMEDLKEAIFFKIEDSLE